jgi:hypothetical protein
MKMLQLLFLNMIKSSCCFIDKSNQVVDAFKAMLKIFFRPHQQMQTLIGTSWQENLLNCVDMWLMLKTTSVRYLGGTNNKTSFQPLLYRHNI